MVLIVIMPLHSSNSEKIEGNQKQLLFRISELELEIKKLKDRKKYGLVWEEKPEDVVLQCKESVPILREVKNRKIVSDNSASNNILIEGDNYHSLSVLNYTHRAPGNQKRIFATSKKLATGFFVSKFYPTLILRE